MSRTLTRKEFLTLTVATGAAALVADACGDSSGSGGAGTSGTTSGTTTGGTSTAGVTSSSSSSKSASSTTGSATSTSSTGGGNACTTDVVAEISCPHTPPHMLTVPIADIMAGVDKTYDIKGQANHSHMVTITAADFATLKSGGTIYKFVEAGSNQDHCVTVSCGTPGDPKTSGQCDAGNAFTCN